MGLRIGHGLGGKGEVKQLGSRGGLASRGNLVQKFFKKDFYL